MTDLDHKILQAMARHPRWHRDAAAELGLSQPRFSLHALRLLRDPEAEATDPVTVHRWRRILAQRKARRGS